LGEEKKNRCVRANLAKKKENNDPNVFDSPGGKHAQKVQKVKVGKGKAKCPVKKK